MDIIESVKQAEENAEKIKLDAVEEASRLVSLSEKTAKEESAKIIASAKKESEEIIKEAKLHADVKSEEVRLETLKEVEKIKTIAENNKKAAVEKIFSLI